MRTLGPEVQLPLLALSTLLVYALSRALARFLLRLLHLTSPFWGALLPWGIFQAYLAVGLFVWGGLPAPAGAYLGVVGVTGLVSLGVALARRRLEPWRLAALMIAWAAVWLGAWIWSSL